MWFITRLILTNSKWKPPRWLYFRKYGLFLTSPKSTKSGPLSMKSWNCFMFYVNKKCSGDRFGTIFWRCQKKIALSEIKPVRWFSVTICKYEPGYKSHDLLQFECSHWWKIYLKKIFYKIFSPFWMLKFQPMRTLEL